MHPLHRTIGSVIRQSRMSQGMSLDVLAARARCAKSYLSEIENNRRPGPPRTPVLRRIEGALGLMSGTLVEMAAWAKTPGAVLAHVQELESRDRVARRLVDLVSNRMDGLHAGKSVRSLEAAYKAGELRALIDVMTPRGSGKKDAAVEAGLPMQVPLVNARETMAAGRLTSPVAEGYVLSPELADPDAFAARVVGESMLPEYREGDIVIFSPAKLVRSAMDCFVRLEPGRESTFKRVYFQFGPEVCGPPRVVGVGQGEFGEERGEGEEGEWVRLQPLNERYPVRVIHREQVVGMYAAVSLTRPLG